MNLRPNHLSLPPPLFSKYPSSRLSTPLNALIHTFLRRLLYLLAGTLLPRCWPRRPSPSLGATNKPKLTHRSMLNFRLSQPRAEPRRAHGEVLKSEVGIENRQASPFKAHAAGPQESKESALSAWPGCRWRGRPSHPPCTSWRRRPRGKQTWQGQKGGVSGPEQRQRD